ncbi:3-oxo-tetronate kinase [wastewater metagenome]|uniref:3-oxo-tetronate kinase n=2 Tax=unclassified sequences TaxID=12908 RepID=A0A5B8RDW2_9ZZZZ|nr:3-oxo-tetronate kinase [uncultured organism]
MLLGCIADDFTGATDLANNLVRSGMRTVQTIGVPDGAFDTDAVDAVVVALKSRTTPVDEATAESLRALEWLRGAGARQIYFKYCSTFDSTDRGNIGPVTDALMDALGTRFAVVCPAFPAGGRTVYRGYLFAGAVLLNESGMQHHPLTPMTDAHLGRLMERQSRGRAGGIDYETLQQGVSAVKERIDALIADGCRYGICDTLDDAHLAVLAEAVGDHPLVTGGSGLALGLPVNFWHQGLLTSTETAGTLPRTTGPELVISGSCSRATNAQVAYCAQYWPAYTVDPRAIAAGEPVVELAVAWARERLAQGPAVISATADSAAVEAVQAELGVERAGAVVEEALATIARRLVLEDHVGRLVVAGGETSGAVVQALGVTQLLIGPQIDPGVPWAGATVDGRHVALALKSGNFGTEDFFCKAFEALQ